MKRYQVSYQVIVPSSMDPDAVVEKANRIALASSDESHAFRQALTATKNVVLVGRIVATIPAKTIVGQESTSLAPHNQDMDDRSWISVVVCGVAVVMAVSCLATSAILFKHKRMNS